MKHAASNNSQSAEYWFPGGPPILAAAVRREADGRSVGRAGATGCGRRDWSVHSLLCVLGCLLFPLLFGLTGCADPELQTTYGQRTGPFAYSSVNGTAVLSEMFEQAGDTVFSWNVLSPRLHNRVDAIVWFPDDFEPPSEEVCDWLEDWLEGDQGRTLIYVGRDFDAAPSYWKTVGPLASAKDAEEIQRREKVARIDYRAARREIPEQQDHAWFSVEKELNHRNVTALDGIEEWTQGIDATKSEIELNGGFAAGPGFDVLLEADGDVLIGRQEWFDSRLIVVTNGSFLLNYPLINHEHRKLAGRLIDAVGAPGRTVVFLESSAGGPEILDHDPAVGPPLGLDIFNIWPTNWILVHLSIAGIIFCFARFPIFGRPLELEADATSDFGKHVTALGELLAQSGDTSYAESRLAHYRQTIENK